MAIARKSCVGVVRNHREVRLPRTAFLGETSTLQTGMSSWENFLITHLPSNWISSVFMIQYKKTLVATIFEVKEKYAVDFPPQRAGPESLPRVVHAATGAATSGTEALEVMNEDNVENEDDYNAELAKHNKRAAQHEEDAIKDQEFVFLIKFTLSKLNPVAGVH